MGANRKNLTTDEESFQRLLCAAFTIQEYRDRKLSDISMLQPAGRAEPFNSVQCDPDLNLQGVCAGEGEGFDAEVLLERLQQELDLPALPAVGDGTGLRAMIGVALDAAEELEAAQNDLVRDIAQQVLQATHATSAAVGLCLKGRLIWEATAGDSASEIRAMLKTGSGFAGLSASSGTMQSCGNTAFDSRPDAEACRRLGVRAVVVVPLAHEDQLLGMVAVFSRRPYVFGMCDLQALQNLTAEFTAKLQVSAQSANTNTGRGSPVAFNLSPLHQQSGCQ